MKLVTRTPDLENTKCKALQSAA